LCPLGSPSGAWRLYANKKGAGKAKKGPVSSMRGFGVFTGKNSGPDGPAYEVMTDPDILELVRWLENKGASLSGLAVARFPTKGNIRGQGFMIQRFCRSNSLIEPSGGHTTRQGSSRSRPSRRATC
jgi:hypothetical protein